MRILTLLTILLTTNNLLASADAGGSEDLRAYGTVGSSEIYPLSTVHLQENVLSQITDAAGENYLTAGFVEVVNQYHDALVGDSSVLRARASAAERDFAMDFANEVRIHKEAVKTYMDLKAAEKIKGFADVGFPFGSALFKFDSMYNNPVATVDGVQLYGHEYVGWAYAQMVRGQSHDALQLVYSAAVPESFQSVFEGSMFYNGAARTYTFPHAGYVFGGWGQPYGRDCSSILGTVLDADHFSTFQMAEACKTQQPTFRGRKITHISKDDMELGDVLVFRSASGGHTGIFMGWADERHQTVYLGDLNRTDKFYNEADPTTYAESCGIGFRKRALVTEGYTTYIMRFAEEA